MVTEVGPEQCLLKAILRAGLSFAAGKEGSCTRERLLEKRDVAERVSETRPSQGRRYLAEKTLVPSAQRWYCVCEVLGNMEIHIHGAPTWLNIRHGK